MKQKKPDSIYKMLGKEIGEQSLKCRLAEKIDLAATVRRLRIEKKLSGAELCRMAGDLDPRTLTAVEKGRIVNPSVKTLQSVARALEVTVSDLFREAEIAIDRHFYAGSQKGAYQIDFPAWGARAVSFTPFIRNFFCGKLILGPRKKLDQTFLNHPLPLFVSTLMGRFEILVEGKKMILKEGENLFFNGILRHSFYNPLEREAALLLVTAPSFL